MPGVTVVRDGDFIGVAAVDELKAQKAILSIEAKWQQREQAGAKELFPFIKGHAAALSTVYTVAYIAHVPLEPRAAVAEFSGNRLFVQTGTQRPFGVREELARAFKMPGASARPHARHRLGLWRKAQR
ncbi:MAG: molybdopterin-dependent oxidoreductase [Acidobacteriaceae bacterium]|nr:molybdopterin-dependent oxidoreductase [Acidobacteriaceae bacterium]